MSDFLKNVKAAADSTGADHTKATGGDFERTVYPEGPVKLRFVGYAELGKHESEYKGVKKTANKVRLSFEVSGPKHQPVVGSDGVPRPLLVHLTETLSTDPKANYTKLFSLLNYARAATHAVHLLGEAYIGELIHRRYKRKSDPAEQEKWTGLDYKLRGQDGAYTIKPPRVADMDTGDVRVVQVDPPRTPLMAFLWDAPSKEQWDSIFIPGEYPERKNEAGVVIAKARSKNAVQEQIMRAVNFKGSPIYAALMKAGVNLDLAPEAPDDDEDAGSTPAKPAGKPVEQAAPDAGPDIDDIPW